MARTVAAWIVDSHYRVPGLLSVISFMAGSDVPVHVHVLGQNTSDTLQRFAALASRVQVQAESDTVGDTEERCDIRRHIRNRIARMELVEQTPACDRLLLFDADVVFSTDAWGALSEVLGDPDPRRPSCWGVPEHARAVDATFHAWRLTPSGWEPRRMEHAARAALFEQVYGAEWPRLLSGVLYNNGVLAFEGCAEVARVWRRYFTTGLAHPSVNAADDQLPLSAALRSVSAVVRSMPDTYNSKGKLSGNYLVYHAYAALWKEELRRLAVGLTPLSDFGRICWRYWDLVPRSWHADLLAGGNP